MKIGENHLREAVMALEFWSGGPKEVAARSLALSLAEAEHRGFYAGAKFTARAITAISLIWAVLWWASRS